MDFAGWPWTARRGEHERPESSAMEEASPLKVTNPRSYQLTVLIAFYSTIHH